MFSGNDTSGIIIGQNQTALQQQAQQIALQTEQLRIMQAQLDLQKQDKQKESKVESVMSIADLRTAFAQDPDLVQNFACHQASKGDSNITFAFTDVLESVGESVTTQLKQLYKVLATSELYRKHASEFLATNRRT